MAKDIEARRAELQAELAAAKADLAKTQQASSAPVPLEFQQNQENLGSAELLELGKTAANRPLRPVSGAIRGPEIGHRQAQADQRSMDDARNKLFQAMGDMKQVDTFIALQKSRLPIGQGVGGAGGAAVGAAVGGGIAAAIGQIPPLTALPEEAVTVPLGKFLGGTIGAGLGGAAGEAAQQVLAPDEAVDIYDIKRAGVEEALWEGGTRMGFAALKKIGPKLLPGFKRPKTEMVRDAKDVLEADGGFLSTSQEDVTGFRNWIENLVAGSAAGEREFYGLNRRQVDSTFLHAKGMIDRTVGEGMLEAGAQGRLTVNAGDLAREVDAIFAARGGSRVGLLEEITSPMYDLISRQSGVRIPTDDILTFIDDALHEFGKTRSGMTKEGAREAKALQKLLETTPEFTIGEIQKFRTARLADARKFKGLSDVSSRFFDGLASVTDDAMFNPNIMTGMPPELALKYRDLNSFYAGGRQIWDEYTIKSLALQIDKNPEKVTDIFFKSLDHQRVSDVKEIFENPTKRTIRSKKPLSGGKEAIGGQVDRTLSRVVNPEIRDAISMSKEEGKRLFKKLTMAEFATALDKSTDADGLFKKGAFEGWWNGMSSKTKKLMYTADEIKEINKVNNTIKVINRRKSMAGPALIGRRSEQIGMIIGGGGAFAAARNGLDLGSGLAIAAGGTLVVGPAAAAKVLTTKGGNKLFKAGLEAVPGSPELITTARRMLRILTEEKTKEQVVLEREARGKKVQSSQPVHPSLAEQRGSGGRGF